MPSALPVYLEVGLRRVFACALDWPGWCRSGRDEHAALEALLASGPRYERALGSAGRGFKAPTDLSPLEIVERLEGNAPTDFGAPDMTPEGDHRPLEIDELEWLVVRLKACWEASDRAAAEAVGAVLRKGPRGGGRDLDAIIDHLLEADRAYLLSLGGSYRKPPDGGVRARMEAVRAAFVEALAARARGDPPATKRRSSKQPWLPRFAVRRSAWHALDHAWEIEDRAQP